VIATVTAMGYLGSVAGPPIVGALSSPLGLRPAFIALPIVAASIGLLALKRLGASREASPQRMKRGERFVHPGFSEHESV
jgi:MFS family permease